MNLGLTLDVTAGNATARALVDLSGAQAREFSYAALDALANGVAASVDTALGKRVGIIGQNSAEYVAAIWGVMRAGCVAVPISFKFPDETLAYICKDAALEFAYADNANIDRMPCAQRPLAEIAASESATLCCEPDATGLVLYTSGSTGRPKGVLLSHESQWSMVRNIGERMRGITSIIAAPLYHMNGLLYMMMTLHGSGTAVLMPRFNAAGFLAAIDRFSVNVLSGVPTMLALMARERELVARLDLSSVRAIQIGSAPLSETVINEALAMFPNARISNGYGTTEAGAGMFGAHPDNIPVPPVALGYPQPHVEVRLAGGTDDEGTLEVKTPAAMNGYLNLPEKTAEKMTGDGWVNTGDIMRRDADGFFYFVGRDDDMFNCGGENISPGEVERILEQDPRIAESCVVAVADQVRGQIPVAFIARGVDSGIDEQGVKDVALAGLPPYMHPRRVYFVDAMPLAGTNKIDRRALQQRAQASG